MSTKRQIMILIHSLIPCTGDVVCEIQTDKAVVALEVDDDGTLAKIIKPADSGTIKVGDLIAVLAEEGEDLDVNVTASTEESAEAVSESEGVQLFNSIFFCQSA